MHAVSFSSTDHRAMSVVVLLLQDPCEGSLHFRAKLKESMLHRCFFVFFFLGCLRNPISR